MTTFRFIGIAALVALTHCAHHNKGLVGWERDEFTVTCKKPGAWKELCGPEDWHKVAAQHCSKFQMVGEDRFARALTSTPAPGAEVRATEANSTSYPIRTYRCLE